MNILQTVEALIAQYGTSLEILLWGIVVSVLLYLLTEWLFHVTGIE